MGFESTPQPEQDRKQTDERAKEQQELRSRIENLQGVVDQDNRQLELAEQRVHQAKAEGKEGSEIGALEEAVNQARRNRDENKGKLDNLRNELTRTYT